MRKVLLMVMVIMVCFAGLAYAGESGVVDKGETVAAYLIPYIQPIVYAVIAVIAALVYKKFGIDISGMLNSAADKGYHYAEAWSAKKKIEGVSVAGADKFKKACEFGDTFLKKTGAGKYAGEFLAKAIASKWAEMNPEKTKK